MSTGLRRRAPVPRRAVLALGTAALVSALAVSAVTAVGAPTRAAAPPEKVRICHATNSSSNPYVSQEPAIGNNGDLNGGHLNHTGPVYPEPGWGDIIPPYEYVDANGVTRLFPGYNWSEEGQAIWGNGCNVPPPPPKPITPILECVERLDTGFLAHFGYDNPNLGSVAPGAGQNVFSPPPENRGQPTSFDPGRVQDAFQVESGEPVTWSLMGNPLTASEDSPRCQGSITVVKHLVPADDEGRFDLRIDGEVAGNASSVGDQGTTGTIAVTADRHTVSETAVSPASLDDYTIDIVCRTNAGEGDLVAQAGAASVSVPVRRNQAILCVITNTAKPQPSTVVPELECVVFDDAGPDVAVWGYRNGTRHEVTIPLGPRNRFTPGDESRGQPTRFEDGRHVGVFQTAFEASSGELVWHLGADTETASATSPRCTASLELRKVVSPASDPGVFDLKLNGTVVASGGNGTTTDPLIIGVGEGTVSESAGAGTRLADYDSSVECTRNGTVAVSVKGTKVDGAVANGDVVVCTFTNVRKGTPTPEPPTPPTPTPPTPTPPTPPVPPPPPTPLPLLDLVVVKTASPTTVTVGQRIIWTMTVTNDSDVEAADVNGLKVNDPRSFRTRLVSLQSSQGTCVPFTCDLGRLAPGASATVTAVTQATQVGVVVDIVRVASEEIESNYRNNVAAALVRVIGPFRPPTAVDACRTLVASPRVLQARRSSIVRLTALDRRGRPRAGVAVTATGPGVAARGRTGRDGVARLALTPRAEGIVRFVGTDRVLAARGSTHCAIRLGVLPARSTNVTG